MSLGLLSPKNDAAIDMVNPVNWLHPLARGLVSWWLVLPGQQSGPRWNDLCRRYPGTLTSMAAPSSSTSGWNGTTRRGGWGEIRFDGTNDYVAVTGLNEFVGSNTTVALWVRVAAYDPNGVLFIATNTTATCYWQFLTDSSIYVSGTLTTGSFNLDDGNWWHVCMTANASSTVCYVNGRVVSTGAAPVAVAAGTKSWAIGDYIGGLGGGFSLNGALDDMLVWNRTLSASEAMWLYQSSLQYYPGLLRRVRRSPQPAPTAAPSGDVPIFMHHYLQMMGSR